MRKELTVSASSIISEVLLLILVYVATGVLFSWWDIWKTFCLLFLIRVLAYAATADAVYYITHSNDWSAVHCHGDQIMHDS